MFARGSASRRSPNSSRTSGPWRWFASWASTSRRVTTWASPSRSRRSGPADPLERDQKGFVGGAGRLLQADLTGAVAAEVRVVIGAGELHCLLSRRGPRQLRVEHPAVAGHAAAGRADRLDHLIGHRSGDLAELALEPH